MSISVCICDDAEAMSRKAVERILHALNRNPGLLLCAAGGSTPLRAYGLLAHDRSRHPDLFQGLRVIKLDEWGGLKMNAPGSCEHQLRTHLVAPLELSEDRYFGFNSDPSDPQAECERARHYLADRGPIDLCVLGLGMNGHLGMNEPAPSLQPEAHIAQLAPTTLRHPMLTEATDSPGYGLTLGMAEILHSREILLLVSGAAKREPLRRLRRREITTEFPASFLWLHPNCTLLCDREAAEVGDHKT